jgi:NADPH:quinone reductase-like Zn-dependent oxidoreductase
MRGTPYIIRLDSGIGAPKDVRAGVDYAGTVEAVGKDVTRFKVGDEVFGGVSGAFGDVGGPPGDWIGPLAAPLKAWVLSPFLKDRFIPFMAQLTPADLASLADLMQSGKVKSVIDRHYPLAQVPQAMAYLESGHARGKVVVDVD